MAEVLRGLIRQLQHIHKKGSVRSTSVYAYILDQYRLYDVTGAKYCRERDEMKYLAQTYLCLLDSTRKHAELMAQYCKGEKTTEQAAHAVGLALPKLPKPS